MGNHSKCYRCGELDEYCVCAAAHPVAGSPVKVAGLGSITNEDDGVLTLRFKDDDAAQAFMQDYEPTVDCRDMPVAGSPAEAANFCPRCGKRLHPGSVHTCTPPAEPMPASDALSETQAYRTGYGEGVRRAAKMVEADGAMALAEKVRNLQSARVPASEAASVPVAWFTEDHRTDKSATTWDYAVAVRWRAKGWPVEPLYLAAPAAPTDAKPLGYVNVSTPKYFDEYNGLATTSMRLYRSPDESRGVTLPLYTAAQSVRDAAQPIAPGKDKP